MADRGPDVGRMTLQNGPSAWQSAALDPHCPTIYGGQQHSDVWGYLLFDGDILMGTLWWGQFSLIGTTAL